MEEIKNEAIAPKVTEGQEQVVDVKALQEKLDQALRSQAGVDKSYAEASKKAKELESELEKLRKEKMSDKEKSEYEFARKNAELEAKSREVAEATLRLSKMKIMGERGIELEYSDYITGNSEEEIIASIDIFTKRLDKLVAKQVEQKLTGSSKPQTGAPPKEGDNLPSDWREIEKRYTGHN